MELKIAIPGKKAGTSKITISDESFAKEFNEPLVHQTVVSYLAGGRQGTIRSPIWRGGGVTFAAKPRDHSKKLNKKMYRGAMRCILSELIRQERLLVVDDFEVESHKTKALVSKLNDYGLDNVLIVSDAVAKNLYLAARNLHRVDVLDANVLDPVSLIGFEKVLMTVPALKKVEEMLS